MENSKVQKFRVLLKGFFCFFFKNNFAKLIRTINLRFFEEKFLEKDGFFKFRPPIPTFTRKDYYVWAIKMETTLQAHDV